MRSGVRCGRANQSTIGCSYYVSPPDAVDVVSGACFAAVVVNTWTTPVKLTVEHDGETLDVQGMARIPSGSSAATTYEPLVNGEIPAQQVALVFLSRFGNGLAPCPANITPGYTSSLASAKARGAGRFPHHHDGPSLRTTSIRTEAGTARSPERRCSFRRARGARTTSA